MEWLVVVIGVLAALVFVIVKKKVSRIGDFKDYPYMKKGEFFSSAERSFLGVLDQAVGKEFRIFGKVRIADAIQPRRGLDASSRQRAFNAISAKHFDFILCGKDDLTVVCAVELDDQSHQQRKRRERDAFLVGLCQAVSLPLIQVKARHGYSVQEVRAKILATLGQTLEPAFEEQEAHSFPPVVPSLK
jgi:hypothetical protein